MIDELRMLTVPQALWQTRASRQAHQATSRSRTARA
jgi:hypothetical protein